MRTNRAIVLVALATLLIIIVIDLILSAFTSWKAEFQDYANAAIWTIAVTTTYAFSAGMRTDYSIPKDKYQDLLNELVDKGFEEHKHRGNSLWLISKGRNILMDYTIKVEQRDYDLRVRATSRERKLLDKYIGLDGSDANS